MRLWRKRRPAVDREQAMADVLERHATRGGKLMPLAEYKHERRAVARQRRAVAAVREVLQTPPSRKTSAASQSGCPSPPEVSGNPWETPPDLDDSEAGRLRRRYGCNGASPEHISQWWTS